MKDPALQPTLAGDLRDLERRISALERLRPYRPTALATMITGGAVRDFGYASRDTTTYVDVFRCDAFCTAPILDYDLQLDLTTWGTSITSVEWRLRLQDRFGTYTVLASDSGTHGEQFNGYLDLFSLVGEDIFDQFIRIDLDIKRTGGSGDGAARFTRPMLLRPTEGP